MFESASWLNRPAQFEVSEDKLTIWTERDALRFHPGFRARLRGRRVR
jgi:regulation of enolase protein 1 (concanavalin A-like superfamily)